MRPQDEIITFTGEVRKKLCKSQFYSVDKLDSLLEIIKNEKGNISSYISSYSIDYTNKTLQIQFRKAFMKKFEDDRYNSIVFYEAIDAAMKKFFERYKTHIYSIMEVEDVLKFYRLPENLFYYISRIGENTVIITL
jgi:hypothetical protein